MKRCLVIAVFFQLLAVAGHAQSGCLRFGPFTLAENGNAAKVTQCLEEELSVSQRYGEQQWTLLQWFLAHSDDAEAIRLLIEAGSDLNTVDDNGITPLHLAAHARQIEAVQLLLDRGVDPDPRDNRGRTPLGLSLTTADSPYSAFGRFQLQSRDDFKVTGHDIYRILVSAGADPLVQSANDETLLHLAAGSDLAEPDVIAELIKAGIDVNATDDQGRTALHETIYPVAVPQVRTLLIAAGADPNIEDNEGNRPIDTVFGWTAWPEMLPDLLDVGMTLRDDPAKRFAQIEAERCNIDDLHMFIQFGFDLTIEGPNGESLFHHMATCTYEPETYMSLLVSQGLSPFAVDNDGNTPLMVAVDDELYGGGRREGGAFAFLAAAGADPMRANNTGVTPWQVALGNNLHDEMLAAFDIDLDGTDDAGQTLLHRAIAPAIKDQSTKFVADFIEGGADLNIIDNAGDTPLHIALDNYDSSDFGSVIVLNTVLAGGPDPTIADAAGRLPVFKWLTTWGGAVSWQLTMNDQNLFSDQQTQGLQTALDDFNQAMQAANQNDQSSREEIRTLEALLAEPFDINVVDLEGKSVLFTAMEHGQHPAVIGYLLARGADPLLVDAKGLNALAFAIAQRRDEAAAALLGAGVDPNITDAQGWTALHHVADRGDTLNPALLAHLMKAEANFSARDQDGRLAVEIARDEVTNAALLARFEEADRSSRSIWERWFQ